MEEISILYNKKGLWEGIAIGSLFTFFFSLIFFRVIMETLSEYKEGLAWFSIIMIIILWFFCDHKRDKLKEEIDYLGRSQFDK